MPLPDGGKKQPWPPKSYKSYLEKIAEHQAWWSGDVKALRSFYGIDEVKTKERRKLREKMFHAQRSEDPLDQPMHLHVPIAGDLASVSANLLFSAPPKFTIPEAEDGAAAPDDDQEGANRPSTNSDAVQAQERLNEIVEETDLANVLLEAADMGSGLSGVFLRPAWDRELDPYPILTAIPAGNALPEFNFGRLRAVTFWWEVRHEDNRIYRRLERHEMANGKGLILHGLYEGDKDSLGNKIPLTELEETRPLAESLTDDGDEIRLDWLDRLLVQYVPNMKPYRRQPAKPWGRSDIDGVEPLMDALDEVYCADEETEILTDHGWVGYRDLTEGEQVLTLNHETGLSEWQPVLEVCVFPAQEREMVSIESSTHSSLTTANHRWPVERRHYRGGTYKAPSGYDRRWATSESFLHQDRVPIAADCADLPEQPKHTDALVEVVAWFWTEGHIRKLRDGQPGRNVTLCQSASAPDRCARIRSALTRLFGAPVDAFPRWGTGPTDGIPRWRECHSGRNITFALSADAGDIVQKLAPGRVPSHPFLMSLTRAQLALFIETSMLADNSGLYSLAQKSRAAAEAFQFACTLGGYGTSITPTLHSTRGKYEMWNVRRRSQRTYRIGAAAQTRVVYAGHVWCPRTANQTWLARRKGKVYFTGNTSWMNDIQLGIRRIIVDDSMLERAGQPSEQGTPAIFRTSQKVFSPLSMTPTEGIDPITIVDFAIRAADHQITARDLVEQIVTSAGYAMQSFSPRFEGTADNASALRIRERKSFQTRDNKGRYWRRPLAEVAELMLAIDRNELGGKAPILRPRIELSDSVAESILDLAQTAQALTTAEAASTETKVRMVHPDWGKEQVDAEVERIQAEGGRAVPDPIGAGDLP